MKMKRAWVACVLFLGATAAVRAGSLGPSGCAPGTFGEYSGGYRCTIGPVDFFNFELYTLDGSGRHPADADLLGTIMVNPSWNPGTSTVSLLINGFDRYPVDADHTAAWLIRYTVDPPPIIGGEEMGLDPPLGNIVGSQNYCADAVFNSDGNCGSGLSGSTAFSIGHPAALVFDPPRTTLDTFTTIRLNPDGNVASSFEGVLFNIQIVTASAPEPGAWLLLGSGLAMITLARRTQNSKRRRGN